MSAHVVLTELGKSLKMQGLSIILTLFRNEFNKSNKAGAQFLGSFYHMILKLLCVKTLRFCHRLRSLIKDVSM